MVWTMEYESGTWASMGNGFGHLDHAHTWYPPAFLNCQSKLLGKQHWLSHRCVGTCWVGKNECNGMSFLYSRCSWKVFICFYFLIAKRFFAHVQNMFCFWTINVSPALPGLFTGHITCIDMWCWMAHTSWSPTKWYMKSPQDLDTYCLSSTYSSNILLHISPYSHNTPLIGEDINRWSFLD